MSLNSKENVLATGSFDNTVKLWDLLSRDFRPIQVIEDFRDSVTKVMFTDTTIVCSSVDGYLRTYDMRMGFQSNDNMNSSINSFDLSSDKNFAVVSCLNSHSTLLEMETGEKVSEYHGEHKSS